MSFRFEKLNIYNDSKVLVKDVYRIINILPEEEKYALGAQIRRSVTSITLNIAEGSQSDYSKDFSKFLNTANKSLAETVSSLELCVGLGYISKEEYDILYNRFDILARQIVCFNKNKKH